MDKLTQMVVDYKESKDESIIKDIQRILSPIIHRITNKWKFDSFPTLIKSNLIEEANTIILAAAIELYDVTKGSKFTSFYATRLNFLFRAEYMKYFQKGKPITKRYGRLHEYSIHHKYGEDGTLEDIIKEDKDIRDEIQNNFLYDALKLLSPTEQGLIESLYLNKTSKKAVILNFDLTYQTIGKAEDRILKKLRRLV